MSNLFVDYDNTSAAAKAVRAYLADREGLQASWNISKANYEARPEITTWYNGRERGYVIALRSRGYNKQLNIAFFEHRNTDLIEAWFWEQCTFNPPSLEQMDLERTHESYAVGPNEAIKMASWIYDKLNQFWIDTSSSSRYKRD